MNHIYRTVFSRTKGCWIAVSELTKSSGKKNKKLKRRLRRTKLMMKRSLVSSIVFLGMVPAKSVKAQWLSVDSGAVHSQYDQNNGGNKIALNPKTGEGNTNSANVGNMGVAVGVNAKAGMEYSIAIGFNATVQNAPHITGSTTGAIAIGSDAKTLGNQGVTVGQKSMATSQSVAIGANTYATGLSSVAIGNDDLIDGLNESDASYAEYSIKLPENTIKDIYRSLYEGNYKYFNSYNDSSDKENEKDFETFYGKNSKWGDQRKFSPTFAGKRGAIAIGSRTIAAGITSTSIGSLSFALADNSTAMGIQAFVASDAKGGTAIGERSRVFAGNSVAIGNRTEASNQGTVAYGYNAKAVGKSSIAIGANVAAAAKFDTSRSAKLVEYYNQLNTSLNSTNDDVAINAFDDGLKTVLDNGLPLTTDGDTYLTIGNDEIKKLATSNGGTTAKPAENAVVIGNKSFAVKKNSLAVGYATLADADNSFALGSYTYVSSGGINSIGLGVGSYVTGKNAFAGGTSATVKADNSIALGAKSLVGEGSGSSNAIGVNAKVLSSKSTALGTDVKIAIGSDNSIVLGNESKLGGGSGHSVIIGDNASIAKDSILDGNNKGGSPYAIAIGQSATIGANSGNSMAIGASASIAEGTTRSIALGNEANASLDNSVALGYRSTTKYFYDPNQPGENTYGPRLSGTDANTLQGYVPPGSSYKLPIDNSAGVISVGGWDKGNGEVGLRRIINVSPGALDTDVATVGQLRALYYARTEPNMVYYAELYGKKVKLAINEENKFVPIDTTTGEPIKGAVPIPDSVEIKIGVKNPDATTEDVLISLKGENGGVKTGNKPLTLLGSAMVMGNVARGTIAKQSTDAINGDQLADLSEKLGITLFYGHKGFTQPDFVALKQANGTTQDKAITFKKAIDNLISTVNQGVIFSDSQTAENDKHQATQYLGSKLTLKPADNNLAVGGQGGQNLAVEYTKDAEGNGTFTFALKNEPIFNKISGGSDKPELDFTGNNLSINHKKLTGLANAEISTASTDAVTGQQLFALADDPEKAINQGITVNKANWKKFLDVGSSVLKFKGDNEGNQQFTLGNDSVLSITGENGISTESGANSLKIKLESTLNTKLDNLADNANETYANKNLANIDQNGKTVVKNLAKEAVNVTSNDSSVKITTTNGDVKTFDLSLSKEKVQELAETAKLQQDITENKDKITTNESNINKNTTEIAKGLSFSTDDNQTVKKALGETLAITGGDNITTSMAGGKIKIRLNSVLTGIQSVIGNGTTLTLNSEGLSLNDKTISGVKGAVISATSDKAVNGSQLYTTLKNLLGDNVPLIEGEKLTIKADVAGVKDATSIGDAIAKLNQKITDVNDNLGATKLAYKVTNGSTSIMGSAVALSEGLDFVGDQNITTGVNNGGKVTFSLKTALTGITSIAGNGTTLSFSDTGISLGNKKITGITDGEISNTSTEAINGKQLHTLTKAVLGTDSLPDLSNLPTYAEVKGSGATHAPTSLKAAVDNLITAVNKGYKFSDGVIIGVEKALGSTLTITKASSDIQFSEQWFSGDNLYVGYSDNDTKFTIGLTKTPTFETLKVTKNGSRVELDSTGIIGKNGDEITAGLKFETGKILLQGNGSVGITLDNLNAGKIAQGSKEAINGDQVRQIVDSLGTVLGNGISIDENGQFIAGSKIAGTNANTITGAIEELNKNISGASLTYQANGNGVKESISLKEGVLDFHGDNNITTSVAKNGVVNIQLNKDLNLDSLTLGANDNDQLRLNKDGLTVKGKDGIGTAISENGVTIMGKEGSSELTDHQLVFKDQTGNNLAGIKAEGKDKLTLVGGNDGVILDNLKGGEIKSGSKQAITGDQLAGLIGKETNSDGTVENLGGTTANTIDGAISEVNTKVDDLAGKVEGGLSFASDNGTTKRQLGDTFEIKGGADSNQLTENNIGVVTNGNGVKVKLAENLTGLNSIEMKNGIRIDQNGISGIKSILEPTLGEDEPAENTDIFAKLAELVDENRDNIAEVSTDPTLTTAVNLSDFSKVATSLNE
ncbi:hypothetical protein CEP45_03715 [Mergibacter septicus]|uniref:ESPR-type extended signal peptide-containing protein n=1 Tax=Mergibacter septicus TaxID=221402 RepID=UPI001C76C3E9|nr:ESPR-type extended signal peptide-containing protein [Mergibacter septicus]QDJ13009.1 hypothetical protein CEP45_03715 [Mergibacter septicus]